MFYVLMFKIFCVVGALCMFSYFKLIKDLSTLTRVGWVCKTEIYCFLESVNQMMMCIHC